MPRLDGKPVLDVSQIILEARTSPPYMLEGIITIFESMLRSKEHSYHKREWGRGERQVIPTLERIRPVVKRPAVFVDVPVDSTRDRPTRRRRRRRRRTVIAGEQPPPPAEVEAPSTASTPRRDSVTSAHSATTTPCMQSGTEGTRTRPDSPRRTSPVNAAAVTGVVDASTTPPSILNTSTLSVSDFLPLDESDAAVTFRDTVVVPASWPPPVGPIVQQQPQPPEVELPQKQPEQTTLSRKAERRLRKQQAVEQRQLEEQRRRESEELEEQQRQTDAVLEENRLYEETLREYEEESRVEEERRQRERQHREGEEQRLLEQQKWQQSLSRKQQRTQEEQLERRERQTPGQAESFSRAKLQHEQRARSIPSMELSAYWESLLERLYRTDSDADWKKN